MLETAVRIVPCALLVCLWLIVIPPSGGYFPRSWYPVALASVLFFYVFRVATRAQIAPSRPLRLALVLFAAVVAWAFLSITWAPSPGSAWESANKLVVVLAMAGIVSLIAWTEGALAALLGAWALGVALLCAGRLVVWLGADDLTRFFESASARMSDPLGYPNATAALPAMAMIPALALSATRGVSVWIRAAALPVAVFLVEFALFAQSRGALGGALAALLVLVVLAGERMRILVRLAVVVVLAAPAVKPVLDVGNAALDGRNPVGPLHDAAPWIIVTVLLAAAAGVLLALADEKVRVPERAVRAGAVAATVAALVVAGGATVAYGGAIKDWAREAWSTGTQPSGEQSRLLSLAPEERPDYARVAVDMFQEHPVRGVGAGNFGREYDARRHLEKHSRYAHDIWLRVLGEQGVVGLLLFLGMLGALVFGAVRQRRVQSPFARTLVGASFGVGAYFLAHGSLDWLEEFPALAMPAVALPFAAVALVPRGPRSTAPAPRWVTAGWVAGLVAVVVALVPAWFSVRYLDRSRELQATDTAAAFRDIDRAASWNPLSAEPLQAEGALALALGNTTRARAAFNEAIDREPTWFSYLQLALIDASQRRFDPASRLLQKAASLDAVDPVIAEARRKISHREKVNPSQVNEKAMESPLFRRSPMP
jgi:hypothetical protein